MHVSSLTPLTSGLPPDAQRQGIAYVGVREQAQFAGQPAVLTVAFVLPLAGRPYLLDPRSYALTGGERIVPRITGVRRADDRSVALALDRIGDFSVYTLTVGGPDLDPFYASRPVRFRLDCDAPYDCEPGAAPAPAPAEPPVAIDYLAKDYVSFRQALFDFAATRFPAWIERDEADLGVMLAELLAATADTLSYQQDRVANEAFLATALERRSVADHLALVGYALDEGAAAATFLHFTVAGPVVRDADHPIQVSNRPATGDEVPIVFETLGPCALYPAHNAFAFYTWGHADATVPQGAQSVALAGELADLHAGDYLAFTAAGTSDVVRLSAEPQFRHDGANPYTVVAWSALTPLQADYPTATAQVLGNVVPATHGRRVEPVSRAAADIATFGRHAHVALPDAPLVFLDPATLALAAGAAAPAQPAPLAARTRRSVSSLAVQVDGTAWDERPSLLDALPNERVFSLKVSDDGHALLIFGDGTTSPSLPPAAQLAIGYRTGGGSAGNVARGVLAAILDEVAQFPDLVGATVENVVAATGGRDRESAAHAKRYGPRSFLQPLVAVTTDDYAAAALAARDAAGAPLLQRAQAAFRWTGSWLTVKLTVDPVGGTLDPARRAALLAQLEPRRLAGYDLELLPAEPVALELDVELCVLPGAFGPTVAEAVRLALVAFFAPDRFSFGDAVRVSRLYAAIYAVAGVASARIVTLARYRSAHAAEETAANLAAGQLAVGSGEIVRLDDDRDFPERGVLGVTAIGTSA